MFNIYNPPTTQVFDKAENFELTEDYARNVINFTGAADAVCTIPKGLRVGYSCTIVQAGTGKISFEGANTDAEINGGLNGQTKGNWGWAKVICLAEGKYTIEYGNDAGAGGGGANGENFANTDLTANFDRQHNFDNHSLAINKLRALYFNGGTVIAQGRFDGLNKLAISKIDHPLCNVDCIGSFTGNFYTLGQGTFDFLLTYLPNESVGSAYVFIANSLPPSSDAVFNGATYRVPLHYYIDLPTGNAPQQILAFENGKGVKIPIGSVGNGGGGAVANLQQVTDVGNTTTNNVMVVAADKSMGTILDTCGAYFTTFISAITNLLSPAIVLFNNATKAQATINIDLVAKEIQLQIPNKSGTFALLDDVQNGGSQDLQQVLNINATAISYMRLINNYFLVDDLNTLRGVQLENGVISMYKNNRAETANLFINLLTGIRNFELPDKSGTIALLDDISSGNFVPITGTEPSKPITGNIELQTQSANIKIFQSIGGSSEQQINFNADNRFINIVNYDVDNGIIANVDLTDERVALRFEKNGISTNFSITENGIDLVTNNPNHYGIRSNINHRNANSSPLDFVQLKYIDEAIKPYKVYTALLSQVGTAAPTAIILQNELGTIYFEYEQRGSYLIKNDDGILAGNVFCIIANSIENDCASTHIQKRDNSTIQIITKDSKGFEDNILINTSVEIRVYP